MYILLKLTRDRPEASRGLSPTAKVAKLLVNPSKPTNDTPTYISHEVHLSQRATFRIVQSLIIFCRSRSLKVIRHYTVEQAECISISL